MAMRTGSPFMAYWKKGHGIAMRYLAIHSLLLLVAGVVAQQESSGQRKAGVDVQVPGVRVQTNVDRPQTDVRLDANHNEKRVVRASELVGLNVQNKNDETVGEIKDIVLDPNQGRVRYIAFGAGGILGLGDKYFAIPWASFECRKDGDKHKVILNVDKNAFTNAKGFDKDHWPDMANEQWQLENNRAFETRSANRPSTVEPPSSR